MGIEREHFNGGVMVSNLDAAVAAQKAFEKGEDPFEAAKKVAESQPVEVNEDDPVEVEALRRRYLLAVCRLGSGRFEKLNTRELLDIALLVQNDFDSIADWTEAIKSLER
jgi:hypothetical protein